MCILEKYEKDTFYPIAASHISAKITFTKQEQQNCRVKNKRVKSADTLGRFFHISAAKTMNDIRKVFRQNNACAHNAAQGVKLELLRYTCARMRADVINNDWAQFGLATTTMTMTDAGDVGVTVILK